MNSNFYIKGFLESFPLSRHAPADAYKGEIPPGASGFTSFTLLLTYFSALTNEELGHLALPGMGDRVNAAIIEDKTGRRAIRSRFFIDASGDGDLLRRVRFGAWQDDSIQPVSYQMLVSGLGNPEAARVAWNRARTRATEFHYPQENATPWFADYPSRLIFRREGSGHR